ncbi:MAG: AbrB/MazE/SpoVT family DNA-binding domain-containing protein [bacterium]
MANQITLRKIGGSVGATFPKEVTDALNVGAGDKLNIVRTDAGILLTPYDPAFEVGMQAFEKVNSAYRNALRELSKK